MNVCEYFVCFCSYQQYNSLDKLSHNFGFYLIRSLKEKCKNVKIEGYQHGIFYKNLLWLEVISKIKFSDKYFPHKIYAFNKSIIKDYKSFYGTKHTQFQTKDKKISEIEETCIEK